MSLDFVAEVWDALRTHIDFNERSDAADTLINLLIDNVDPAVRYPCWQVNGVDDTSAAHDGL